MSVDWARGLKLNTKNSVSIGVDKTAKNVREILIWSGANICDSLCMTHLKNRLLSAALIKFEKRETE
jgi:hypothetical protein